MQDRQRRREHGKWVSWLENDDAKKGPQPPPGYKDCRSCNLRDDWDTLSDKTRFCEEQCPYDDLPTSPSLRFLIADEWSRLPEAILAKYEAELDMDLLFEIQALREERMNPFAG